MCRSVPHNPVRSTLIRTSSASIFGSGTSCNHRPGLASAFTSAFTAHLHLRRSSTSSSWATTGVHRHVVHSLCSSTEHPWMSRVLSSRPMSYDRDGLLEQVKTKAIVHGKVTLASGKEADYYVDLRRITLDAAAAPLIGPAMLELTEDLEYDAVGGLTLGADPVAMSMLHAAAQQGRGPAA